MRKGLLIFLLSVPLFAQAHNLPYTAINTELQAKDKTIELKTTLKQDVSLFYYFPASDSEARQKFYQQYFAKNFPIAEEGQLCNFSLNGLIIENGQTIFTGRFDCSQTIKNISELTIHASIFADEFVNFDHFVSLSLENQKWDLVFNKKDLDYPQSVAAKSSFSFSRFVWLGLEHIFTGYDHILFILSLILLVTSFRKILTLVTAFTFAHSITLFLAGLNIVRLSPRLVEPLIALSIAYVAYRNIERSQDERQEGLKEGWFTSFGFGLIHGLGFASALSATPIPASIFLPAVLTFNLGIEFGQFTVIALASPLLYLMNRSSQKKKIAQAVSVTILAIAIVLIVIRLR